MPPPTIAYFVTPHGFGHASRAAAVMEAVGRRFERISFDVVTAVPDWFFSQSLSVDHRVRPVASDVGLVQIDPVRADLPATVAALETYWSGLTNVARELIDGWGKAPPRMVVSDISPLGLEVAARLGVPSILVENFTWDWIYAAYFDQAPRLREFARRSAELAATATCHIQCEPICEPATTATTVRPVSRTQRSDRAETRLAVGLDERDGRSLVLLTMGGMGWGSRTPDLGEGMFLVALGGVDELSREDSILRLPNRSPIYPPDLIWAADAVIGKLGYSTVAECYRAGARLGYISRPGFPESPVLEEFVRRSLPAVELTSAEIGPESWRAGIEQLLDLPRSGRGPGNGAEEIADLLQALLE